MKHHPFFLNVICVFYSLSPLSTWETSQCSPWISFFNINVLTWAVFSHIVFLNVETVDQFLLFLRTASFSRGILKVLIPSLHLSDTAAIVLPSWLPDLCHCSVLRLECYMMWHTLCGLQTGFWGDLGSWL